MIKVICVGKLKEKYLADAVMEYSKRISKYSNIQIIEVNDSNVDNEKIALEREKELILKHINTKDYIITLEIDGKQLTSIEFASKIDEPFSSLLLKPEINNISFIRPNLEKIYKKRRGCIQINFLVFMCTQK